MKCYFDGSQATDVHGHSWLTLAGYVGGDSFWEAFPAAWTTKVLKKREPVAPELHMRKLIFKKKPFDRWDLTRRENIVKDANAYLQSIAKTAFCSVVCSIDVTARDELVKQGCKIMPAHEVCAQWCISKSFTWYYETWEDRLQLAYLYFDRGEPFMHDFRQRWLREKKGKVVFLNTLWGSIVEVEALSSTETPALQAADFISWAVSRGRSSVEDRPYRHLVNIHELIMPRWKLTLDEGVLRKKHLTLGENEGNVAALDELSDIGVEPMEGSGNERSTVTEISQPVPEKTLGISGDSR